MFPRYQPTTVSSAGPLGSDHFLEIGQWTTSMTFPESKILEVVLKF